MLWAGGEGTELGHCIVHWPQHEISSSSTYPRVMPNEVWLNEVVFNEVFIPGFAANLTVGGDVLLFLLLLCHSIWALRFQGHESLMASLFLCPLYGSDCTPSNSMMLVRLS